MSSITARTKTYLAAASSLACAAALFAPITSAHAADESVAAEAEAAAETTGGITDIVVTAQKRAESAQTVPISIQSYGSERLEQLGASKLQDIEASAPSLTFGDGSEQGRTGVRGVIDYSRAAGYDSRVGIYIDGVYLSRSWMNNQTLLGIQQVDVLRGPQGTLFGKDTDAGAVSITTKQPTFDTNGEVEFEYGSFHHWKAAGRVNVPLSDTLAVQLSATHLQSDGYYYNDTLGERNQGVNSDAARIQVRFEPSSGMRFTLSGDYTNDNNSTVHYTNVPAPGADPFHFVSYVDDYAKRRMGGASLTGEIELGGGYDLTSITAYRSGKQRITFNNETGVLPVLKVSIGPSTDQFSQELRIASPTTGNFDFVAGLYYFWGNNKDHQIAWYGPALAFFGPLYAPYAGMEIPSFNSVSSESYAGFVNAKFRPIEEVEIFAGGRLSYEKKNLNYINTFDPIGVIAVPLSGYSDKMSDWFFTPKAGVNIRPSRNVMIFASYARGFKSGGWNVEGTSPLTFAAGIDYKPEDVNSFEIGVKSDFLDRRARLNVTGFYQKFKDFQVFTFAQVVLGGIERTTVSLTNAGEVSSKGIEVEATFVPFDGLTLSGNYTYNISKFDKYPGGGGVYDGAQLSADGVQTPYAPKHKAYFSIDYSSALGGTDLMADVHFGYSTQTSQNFDPKVVNPLFHDAYYIKGYDLADARLAISRESEPWKIAVWSKNLFDKEYVKFTNRTAFLGNTAVIYGEPRTIGATFSYDF